MEEKVMSFCPYVSSHLPNVRLDKVINISTTRLFESYQYTNGKRFCLDKREW
jgi:hypothetical protein